MKTASILSFYMVIILCSQCFAGEVAKNETLQHLRRMGARGAVSFLSKLPPSYFKESNPSHDELVQATVSLPPNLERLLSDLSHNYLLEDFLNLFAQIPNQGHFYFLGNGMYGAYILSKSAYRGTDLHDRLHYIPISRELVDKLDALPEAEKSKFLANYGLNRVDPKSPMYFLDNVTATDKPNSHEVLKFAHFVRSYLVKRGFSLNDVLSGLFALGIFPAGASQDYKYKDFDELRARQSNFESLDLDRYKFPILELKVSSRTASLFYAQTPRWNSLPDRDLNYRSDDPDSKFVRLDQNGYPVSRENFWVSAVKQERALSMLARGPKTRRALQARDIFFTFYSRLSHAAVLITNKPRIEDPKRLRCENIFST